MDRLKEKAIEVLRWSERFTKTDMVYATRGGAWLFAAKVLMFVTGFGMSVAFANLMEPEKYGVYKYILSLVSIASTFALVGMATAVNQATARGFEGALRKGFMVSLRWSAGIIVVAGGMALYYFLNGNNTIGIGLLVGGALMPFISASSLYDNYLGGTQRFGPKTWYNTMRAAVPAVALIVTLLLTDDPAILATVYFVSTLSATYWCYRNVLSRYRPHDRTDDTTHTFSKHLSLMSIVTTMIAQLDRVLIFSQLGGTSLALYAFAEAGPDQLRGLGSIVGSLALPKMSQTSFGAIRNTIARKAFVIFLGAVIVTSLYIMAAPYLFSFFFPRYMEAVLYSQVYALIIPITLPSVLFSQALIAHMKKSELYWNNIPWAIMRVVLLVTLVQYYGIWGIIVGTIIYYATSALFLMWSFYRSKI